MQGRCMSEGVAGQRGKRWDRRVSARDRSVVEGGADRGRGEVGWRTGRGLVVGRRQDAQPGVSSPRLSTSSPLPASTTKVPHSPPLVPLCSSPLPASAPTVPLCSCLGVMAHLRRAGQDGQPQNSAPHPRAEPGELCGCGRLELVVDDTRGGRGHQDEQRLVRGHRVPNLGRGRGMVIRVSEGGEGRNSCHSNCGALVSG